MIYSKEYIISTFFHLILFSSIILLNKDYTNNIDQIKKEYLISNSIKVDVAGLPSKTLKELKNIPLHRTTNKRELISKELEDFSKSLKILGKSKIRRKKIKNKKIDTKKLRSLILKGNIVKSGNSTEGRALTNIQDDWFEYARRVRDKVKKNWELPSYLLSEKDKVKINILLNESGDLVEYKIIVKSSSDDFVSYAIKAIKKAAPFAVPSNKVSKILQSSVITLVFPME